MSSCSLPQCVSCLTYAPNSRYNALSTVIDPERRGLSTVVSRLPPNPRGCF